MKLKHLSLGLLLTWLLIACAAPIVEEAADSSEPQPTTEQADDASEATASAGDEARAQPATAVPPTDEPASTATAEPAPTKASLAASLPRISKAPDITNETWLNSEPMTLSGLEGKVVLVEFWTYT